MNGTSPLLVDVAPRDGLQNETVRFSTEQKIELIHRIGEAGVRAIEVTAFVSPKWVPQMADAAEVAAALADVDDIEAIALVVNDQGFERAMEAGIEHVRLVVSVTDTMNSKNANRLPEETMSAYEPLLARADAFVARTLVQKIDEMFETVFPLA